MGKKIIILHILCIAVCGFLVYGNSLRGEFIWDDFAYVKDNVHIKDWSFLPGLFSESVGAGVGVRSSFYRPVQMVSYMADYSVWKLDVFGYHLTNTLLHILASIGIYWLLCLLWQRPVYAVITAVLYAVHPVHTEAVASIAGRADSLSLFFFLLSFSLYIKAEAGPSQKIYTVFCLFSYALALLSKESALIFPVLLAFYHGVFKRRFAWKTGAGIFLITGAYLMARALFLKTMIPDVQRSADILARIPGFFAAIWGYSRILLFPWGLHVEYGDRLFAISDPSVGAGVFAISIILVYAFRSRRDALTVFAVGWFFITLVPVSNIYRINPSFMKEHWLYVPSIGFFMVIADRLLAVSRYKRFQMLSVCMIAGIIIFYGILTVRQNTYWREFIYFCRRSLVYAPESAGMHNNLGNAYSAAGRYGEAIQEYKKALSLDPGLSGIYYNLTKAYRNTGDNAEAARIYAAARNINAERVRSYYDAGNKWYDRGDYVKAVDAYKQALLINPVSKEIYNNLANAYLCLGKAAEAIAWSKKALEIDPALPEAHNNLAVAYYYARQYDLAVVHCDKARALGYPVQPGFLKSLRLYRK